MVVILHRKGRSSGSNGRNKYLVLLVMIDDDMHVVVLLVVSSCLSDVMIIDVITRAVGVSVGDDSIAIGK